MLPSGDDIYVSLCFKLSHVGRSLLQHISFGFGTHFLCLSLPFTVKAIYHGYYRSRAINCDALCGNNVSVCVYVLWTRNHRHTSPTLQSTNIFRNDNRLWDSTPLQKTIVDFWLYVYLRSPAHSHRLFFLSESHPYRSGAQISENNNHNNREYNWQRFRLPVTVTVIIRVCCFQRKIVSFFLLNRAKLSNSWIFILILWWPILMLRHRIYSSVVFVGGKIHIQLAEGGFMELRSFHSCTSLSLKLISCLLPSFVDPHVYFFGVS